MRRKWIYDDASYIPNAQFDFKIGNNYEYSIPTIVIVKQTVPEVLTKFLHICNKKDTRQNCALQ